VPIGMAGLSQTLSGQLRPPGLLEAQEGHCGVLDQPRKCHLQLLREQPEAVPRQRPEPPRDVPLAKGLQEPFGMLDQRRTSSLEKLVPILAMIQTQPARQPVE